MCLVSRSRRYSPTDFRRLDDFDSVVVVLGSIDGVDGTRGSSISDVNSSIIKFNRSFSTLFAVGSVEMYVVRLSFDGFVRREFFRSLRVYFKAFDGGRFFLGESSIIYKNQNSYKHYPKID